MRRLLVPLLLVLSAGCGPGPHAGGALPASVFEDAAWEAAYRPDELTEYREGIVLEAVSDRGEIRQPFAGALVELFTVRPDGLGILEKVAEATSGADGRFRVGPGPAGGFAVRVTAPGYAPMSAAARLIHPGAVEAPGSGMLQLWLRRSRGFAGRVEDASGAPLGGIEVTATSIAYDETVVSAPDGTFELRAGLGQIEVAVSDPDREPDRQTVIVGKDGTASVTLVSPLLAPIRGRVVDGTDGRPIVGAEVFDLGRRSHRVVSDAEGRFALPMPRRGRMVAVAAGWGWRTIAVPVAGDVEFRLYRAQAFSGRVVDRDGGPVADARVLGLAQRYDGRHEVVRGPLTGVDGSFSMSWIPPAPRGREGVPRWIAFHREFGVSAPIAVGADAAGGAPEARLTGVVTVEGRVARTSGEPVPGTSVEAVPDLGGLGPAESHALGFGRAHDAVVGDDGRYRIADVPRAEGVELRISARGLRDAEPLPAPDAPDVTVQQFDFTLPLGPSISGVVVDASGAPVEDGEVELESLETEYEFLRAVPIEKGGVFRADDLPTGRFRLAVSAPGFDLGSASAEAGDDDVRIVAERLAVVSFDVRFPDDATAAERRTPIRLTLRRSNTPGDAGRSTTATPDAPGQFGKVEQGTYDVLAGGGVWRAEVEGFDVGDGERKTVEVALRRTLLLPVVVLAADGRPLAGEPVAWRPIRIPGSRAERSTTGADGRIDLTGLADGTWEISISPAGAAPLRQEIRIDGGRTDVLELRLPAHGTLVVRVRDADGEAVERAVVAVSSASGEPVYCFPKQGAQRLGNRFATGADGEVGLVGVRAGSLRVRVSGGNSGSRQAVEKTIDVVPGKETVVEFP